MLVAEGVGEPPATWFRCAGTQVPPRVSNQVAAQRNLVARVFGRPRQSEMVSDTTPVSDTCEEEGA
jgi:hypothetical protein